MKRRLDICRNCGKFCHDDNGMACLASDDRIVEAIEDLDNFVSNVLGVPKDLFCFEERKSVFSIKNEDFEEKEISGCCEMKDVYLVGEWANEKKA